MGYKLYILIAIFVYTVAFSAIEIVFYKSFRIFTWDLGIFNQAFWNTLNGRFLYYTSEPFYTRTGCFLGAHFSPAILAVLPLYAIFQTPETLLVISTFVVAIGAIPAYETSNFLLHNEKTATMLGIFYLLYPPLQGVTLSGFSPEPFAVTLFLFIAYYLIKADFWKLGLVVPLGLMTHEASVPVIAFIAVYGMLYHTPKSRNGFLASVIIVVTCIPYFFFAQNMRVLFGWTGSPSLWNEWKLLGATSSAAVPFRIFLNPAGALASLMFDGASKLIYLIMLLLPVLFLPIFSVKAMTPAIPYLLISLFSSYPLYYSLEGHYPAFVVPFIFISFIQGIGWIRRKRYPSLPVQKLIKIAISVALILLIVLLSLSFLKFEIASISERHNAIIHDMISNIPQNGSVLTQSNIFPHLSNRLDAYTIPPPSWGDAYEQIGKQMLRDLNTQGVNYVLVDFNSEPIYASAAKLIFFDFIVPNADIYVLVDEDDGILLYKANL